MHKYKIGESEIYNVNETDVATAVRGTKQVGVITLGERGTLVAICTVFNAIGKSVRLLYFHGRNFSPILMGMDHRGVMETQMIQDG